MKFYLLTFNGGAPIYMSEDFEQTKETAEKLKEVYGGRIRIYELNSDTLLTDFDPREIWRI